MFRTEGKVLLMWDYVESNTTFVRVWSLVKVNLVVILLHLKEHGNVVLPHASS